MLVVSTMHNERTAISCVRGVTWAAFVFMSVICIKCIQIFQLLCGSPFFCWFIRNFHCQTVRNHTSQIFSTWVQEHQKFVEVVHDSDVASDFSL